MTHEKEYYRNAKHFYINDYMSLRSSADMQRLRLFPNAKEITESNAAFWAVKRHLPELNIADPSVDAFSVGDGHTPRTAGMLAFRTRWNCHSIDPLLNSKCYPVDRLEIYRKKIEDLKFYAKIAVIFAVHAHVRLQTILKSFNADKIFIIAMPCCVKLNLDDIQPYVEYEDKGIWSPKNLIRIWR